mgnify:CR=1 FL=1|tara:strand:- start:25 stop:1119 length:1095 start_codon:yes stop_codon:yes gene_type:complete
MSAFDLLKEHYEKNMGNLGAGRSLFPEGSAKRRVAAEDGDMNYGIEHAEGVSGEAEKTREDHARAAEELEDAIQRSRDDREIQKGAPLSKARPRLNRTPYVKVEGRKSGWENEAGSCWGKVRRIFGISTVDTRERDKADWVAGTSPTSLGTRIHDAFSECFEAAKRKVKGKRGRSTEKSLEKAMSPQLSSLLSAAAGWALSADLASKGIPPEMAREWERAISREDKKRLQEEMMRRLKSSVRKSEGSENLMAELQMLYKDHAPVPPRYGLMWDAVKHRWTRPEKVGRTVWEVQGKKRLRGSGTGVHERSLARRGAGGKGTGSMEAGRRFRGASDSGRAHPHEVKHPGHVTVRKPKKQKTKRKAR